MQRLDWDGFSSKRCSACWHPEAFHRENGGACFGDPNHDNKATRSTFDFDNVEARKKLREECWCWNYETELGRGVESVLNNGNRAALIATTDAALQREDYQNAEKLLDCYIRKTSQRERDSDWMRATERSIARFRSDARTGSYGVAQGLSANNTVSRPENRDQILELVVDRGFQWDHLDHQLINLKVSKLAEQMQKLIAHDEREINFESMKRGNTAYFLPAWFDMQKQRAEEWAHQVYEIYCEVWLLQGHSKTPEFVRAVCEKAIDPVLSARQGSVEGQAGLRAQRTGSFQNPQLDAAIGEWHRTLSRMRVSLRQEFEIQALEVTYAVSDKAPQHTSHPPMRTGSSDRRVTEKRPVPSGSASLGEGNSERKKTGRALARPLAFIDLAGELWLDAKRQGGNSTVSDEQLKQIASNLDENCFVPPAKYLEGGFARELRAFNSKNSNSKTGTIQTWFRLIAVGDKDHLRGMRKLLSRCAKRQRS